MMQNFSNVVLSKFILLEVKFICNLKLTNFDELGILFNRCELTIYLKNK